MIILIGTSHIYQMAGADTPEGKELFCYLKNICSKHKINGVGEEMNIDALEEYESKKTIPSGLSLKHCFCDPSKSQRTKHQILQVYDIRKQAFLENWSEEETNIKIQHVMKKREQYWLEKIKAFNQWPLLFVCGYDHVESFAKLINKSGIKVLVERDNWEPTHGN